MSSRNLAYFVLVVACALLACKKEEKGSSAGVGNVGASAGDCKAGEACACNGVGACSKKCVGGGCKFECHGVGACSFECPDGKCTVDSDAMGAVSLECAGGDCKLSCKGNGACSINSCKSGCSTSCTGGGVCTCPSGC